MVPSQPIETQRRLTRTAHQVDCAGAVGRKDETTAGSPVVVDILSKDSRVVIKHDTWDLANQRLD